MQEQALPCPVCQAKIPFEPKALLMGVAFTCPNCFASISIAQDSLSQANEAMEKFEQLKKTVLSNPTSN